MPFAVATPTRKLVFSLPRALERHLGVEAPRPRGEKEVLVWEVEEGDPPKVYMRRAGLAIGRKGSIHSASRMQTQGLDAPTGPQGPPPLE
ncbi:MAG: hypothetical protein JRN24_00265 [Nitrososphaerota archaeon]|nr:hypothetical protein [Nitrososphaerota archaeon]